MRAIFLSAAILGVSLAAFSLAREAAAAEGIRCRDRSWSPPTAVDATISSLRLGHRSLYLREPFCGRLKLTENRWMLPRTPIGENE